MTGSGGFSSCPRNRVVAVVHGAWGDSPDEEDTRLQARQVADSVTRLGFDAPILALGPELREIDLLRRWHPGVIFNLVEGLGGVGRRAHEAAFVLERLGVPVTGVSGAVQEVVNSKCACKQALEAAGLPTPSWTLTGEGLAGDDLWIVKPIWEHGSLGMSENSVMPASQVAQALAWQSAHAAHACFAERYVAGREFNLSIVQGPSGGEVFPAVEMLFEGYPDDGIRIVDYAAKWDASSFGFNHTPRRFEFPEEDRPLLDELRRISLEVWRFFDMTGYVRVDFRVDAHRKPWILEVNANPCIASDAGFVITVLRSGLGYDQLIERLLHAAQAASRIQKC
ncbi:MAG: D-alanine--D-alanine ligase [Magnetococcales bacterium]|nr:D-alanine--D-alanine ligase [Magnetococcales bacterium]